MAVKHLERNPKFVSDPNTRPVLQRATKVCKGDTITYDSDTYTSTGAVTVPLFDNLVDVTVLGMVMRQTTAWTGTGNQFTVGDSDDVDRFFDTGAFVSTDAGGSEMLEAAQMFKYASSDPTTINAYIQVSTGTNAGATVPYIIYTEID